MAEYKKTLEGLPKTRRIVGSFRPHACDNEEVPPQATSYHPSWAALYPELAAKSSGGRVEDLPVVKAYKEDLAKRKLAEKRKAEEVTEATLKALKRNSFYYYFKPKLYSNYFLFRKVRKCQI